MGFYLRWPKSGNRKIFLPGLIGATIYFGIHAFTHSLRDGNDLKATNEFCGVVNQYAFVSVAANAGIDTWRIYVLANDNQKEIFKVGDYYLHQSLQRSNLEVGDNICVRYLSTSPFWPDHRFISQVLINGDVLLEEEKVLNEYMKPPTLGAIHIFIVALILSLLCVIRTNQEEII